MQALGGSMTVTVAHGLTSEDYKIVEQVVSMPLYGMVKRADPAWHQICT